MISIRDIRIIGHAISRLKSSKVENYLQVLNTRLNDCSL